MGKRIVALMIAGVVGAAGVAWGVRDEVELPRARRGVVVLPHRKHVEQWGVRCEQCHHNIVMIRQGQTDCKGCHMNTVHEGLCHDCHLSNREDGYAKKYTALKKKLGVQKIPTLFKAFHGLFRSCHAEVNKKEGRKAPYECGGCHKG